MTSKTSSDSTKRAIVKAAGDILVAEGFAAVTHRSVADKAGVPLGSTTYHFKDKSDLIYEVFKNLFENEKRRRENISVPKRGTPLEIARYVNDLLIPPEFRTKRKMALMYQRIMEATQDAKLKKLLDHDQYQIALELSQKLETWKVSLTPGFIQALFDGRVLQSLSKSGNMSDYLDMFTSDLRLITQRKN